MYVGNISSSATELNVINEFPFTNIQIKIKSCTHNTNLWSKSASLEKEKKKRKTCQDCNFSERLLHLRNPVPTSFLPKCLFFSSGVSDITSFCPSPDNH